MADQLQLRMKHDKAWKIAIKNSAGNPIVFSENDVLQAQVWVGGSAKEVLFYPDASWIVAEEGTVLISISANQVTPDASSDIPSAIEPGKYELLLTVTKADSGKVQEAWSATLELLPVPGTESPLRSYVRYRDLLAISQTILDASSASDETGFAYQCYLASRWLDEAILSRRACTSSIKEGIEAGRLVVTNKVVEIVARRAVGMILGSIGDQEKLIEQSLRQYSMASALFSTYDAEIDVDDDGIITIVPANVLSFRHSTPSWVVRGWH